MNRGIFYFLSIIACFNFGMSCLNAAVTRESFDDNKIENHACSEKESNVFDNLPYDFESLSAEFYSESGVYLFTVASIADYALLSNTQWNILNAAHTTYGKMRLRIDYPSADLNQYYYSPLFKINLAQGGVSL